MRKPLFRELTIQLFDEAGLGEPEWYKSLTLGKWVRGMTERVDHTSAWRRTLGVASRQGVDYLTQGAFPGLPDGRRVEGYGALGDRTDPAPGGRRNPIFELRTPTKSMTVDEFELWALKMFDYIRSVNEGTPTRIT